MNTIAIAERLWLEPTLLGATLNYADQANGLHFRVGIGFTSLSECDKSLRVDGTQWSMKDNSLIVDVSKEMILTFCPGTHMQRQLVLTGEEQEVFKSAIHFLTLASEPPVKLMKASFKSALAFSLAVAVPGIGFAEIGGEDLKFAIKWGLVTAGYSSLKVQNLETIDGRKTHHIVAEARSTGMVSTMYKVNDRNETWIDLQNPATLRYARNIREGKYRLEEQVTLDHETGKFYQRSYRADKDRHKSGEGDIPANVLDVLGSFYYVRTLPLAVGRSFTIDVHSGQKVYPMVVNVTKRQKVKVKAGKFDCFVVEPQLREPGIFVTKGKKLEVFITADERRMPVLMRSEIFIGHVSAELVSHRETPLVETYQLTQGQKLETDPAAKIEQEIQ